MRDTDLTCQAASPLTSTGSIRTSSKEYVDATKSATSWLGASRIRRPSGVATIASANAPSGLRSQRPTTTRTPDVEPTPAMAPSKRCRVTDPAASLLVGVDEEHPVAEVGQGDDDHQREEDLHPPIVTGHRAGGLT